MFLDASRCAWLNHSSTADVFMQILQRHPNIRLWFSGHFHLSHNYADSISVVGRCAFVQTGVIGECNRDGFRHSRVLKGANCLSFSPFSLVLLLPAPPTLIFFYISPLNG